MRFSRLTPLALGAVFTLSAPLALAGHGGKLPFDGEIEKAQARARFEGKPMVYYFTASW